MTCFRLLPLSVLSFALTLAGSVRADPLPHERGPETSARLVLGWLWGDQAVAGLSLRAQVFHRVSGDGGPDFYDLGGELAWESGGPRVSFGARHQMYFVPDARFEQSVLVGVRALSGGAPRIDLSGSFAFHQPLGAWRSARLAPGAHVLWHLGTPTSAPRLEQGVGLGASLAGLFSP